MKRELLYRVLHGGSWYTDSRSWRPAFRITSRPDYRDPDCGLRLVAKAKPQPKLLRGCSWINFSENWRPAYRIAAPPDNRRANFGFRLVAKEKKDEE